MFRSQLFDHLQGVILCASAITTFSACLCRLFGMRLYVVCNIIFALEWFHDYIYQDMKKKLSIWRKGYGLTYVCACLMYLSVGCLVVNCLLLRVGAVRVHITRNKRQFTTNTSHRQVHQACTHIGKSITLPSYASFFLHILVNINMESF